MRNERPTISELNRLLKLAIVRRLRGGGGGPGIRYDLFATANKDCLAVVTIRATGRERPRVASVLRVHDHRRPVDFWPDGRPRRNADAIEVWGYMGPAIEQTEKA